MDAAKRRANTEVVVLTVPRKSHASMGVGEQVQGQVAGIFRASRLHLKSRIGHKLPVDSVLTHWLVKHAAFCYNRFSGTKDGQTPY